MTSADLRRLAGLLEARKARDLARLDRLLAEDRRLAAEVAELARTGVRDSEAGGLPLAQQGLRQTWADQHIQAARRRRSELVPEIRRARAAAAQSLGKHRALDELTEKAERARIQERIARAEREEVPTSNRSEGN